MHFALEAVEQVPTHHLKVNTHSGSSRQYRPRMMLALLIYCYANGAEVDGLERESIEVLVATGRGEAQQYDFRPPKTPKDPPANSQPWIMADETVHRNGKGSQEVPPETADRGTNVWRHQVGHGLPTISVAWSGESRG